MDRSTRERPADVPRRYAVGRVDALGQFFRTAKRHRSPNHCRFTQGISLSGAILNCHISNCFVVLPGQFNVFAPCRLNRDRRDWEKNGNEDSSVVEILKESHWSSFQTYLGVHGIFVRPSTGQRAYSEINVTRCQRYNGEEYGCFGLATDETCLKTSIGSRCATNCMSWQACVYSTELRKDTKKTKTPCEQKECWRSARLESSLCGVWGIEETEKLFFKDGDILGLLVDCTSAQPVLQFFVNKRQMLETPLLESVFDKKLFPAFSVGRHCEIEVVLNPVYPDICKGGEDEDAASQAELGAGGGGGGDA